MIARALATAALLLAACGRSNESILRELERDDPRLDAVLERGGAAVPARGDLRATTLPMRGRIPTVDGSVNGVGMPLVLDTGTSHVSLAGPAARDARVHVPRREATSVLAPGHDVPHRLAVFETLDVGGMSCGPGVATVADREASHWRGAIVGCSVLSRFRVTFDFRRDEVRLAPHGGPGYAHTLFTQVEVNGKPYWMLVDSGASRVVLEPWMAVDLGLITQEEAVGLATKAERETGVRRARVRLETVKVSGREFPDVPGWVLATIAGGSETHGTPVGGLLGLKAFGPLAWTLDFGAKRLTVEGG